MLFSSICCHLKIKCIVCQRRRRRVTYGLSRGGTRYDCPPPIANMPNDSTSEKSSALSMWLLVGALKMQDRTRRTKIVRSGTRRTTAVTVAKWLADSADFQLWPIAIVPCRRSRFCELFVNSLLSISSYDRFAGTSYPWNSVYLISTWHLSNDVSWKFQLWKFHKFREIFHGKI